MTLREFLDTHPGAPWAGLVAIVALWCIGQVVAGEPALDAPADLPPAMYVVAPDVVEVTAVPPASLHPPEARASTGLLTPGDVGPVTSTTPFVDELAAAQRTSAGTHGSTAAGSPTSPTSEGER